MKRTKIFTTRNLVLMAVLIAMQIILARFLSIQASETLRISFESIPVILAGLWLGPIPGVIVALVSDFLGTIIHGYGAWFAPIALGPISVALIAGLLPKALKADPTDPKDTWKILVTVIVAGIVNAFVIGPVTTTLYKMFVMGNDNAFGVLYVSNIISRLATKPFTIIVDTLVSTVINRTVYKPVIRRIVSQA